MCKHFLRCLREKINLKISVRDIELKFRLLIIDTWVYKTLNTASKLVALNAPHTVRPSCVKNVVLRIMENGWPV